MIRLASGHGRIKVMPTMTQPVWLLALTATAIVLTLALAATAILLPKFRHQQGSIRSKPTPTPAMHGVSGSIKWRPSTTMAIWTATRP